jgi:hypothetical protein
MFNVLNSPAITPKKCLYKTKEINKADNQEFEINVLFYEKQDKSDNNFAPGYVGTVYRCIINEDDLPVLHNTKLKPNVNDVLQIEGELYNIINKPRYFNYNQAFKPFYQLEIKSDK